MKRSKVFDSSRSQKLTEKLLEKVSFQPSQGKLPLYVPTYTVEVPMTATVSKLNLPGYLIFIELTEV